MSVPPVQFRTQSELVDYLSALEQRVATLEDQKKTLEIQVENLNRQAPMGATSRTRSNIPNLLMLSPNFLERAFAVWGHNFVAQLIISIPLTILYFILIGAILSRGR